MRARIRHRKGCSLSARLDRAGGVVIARVRAPHGGPGADHFVTIVTGFHELWRSSRAASAAGLPRPRGGVVLRGFEPVPRRRRRVDASES
jgi:hypothetical protein